MARTRRIVQKGGSHLLRGFLVGMGMTAWAILYTWLRLRYGVP
jgi:hypothetical protein